MIWFNKEKCECSFQYDYFIMYLLVIQLGILLVYRRYRKKFLKDKLILEKYNEIMDISSSLNEYDHLKVCNLLKKIYESKSV